MISLITNRQKISNPRPNHEILLALVIIPYNEPPITYPLIITNTGHVILTVKNRKYMHVGFAVNVKYRNIVTLYRRLDDVISASYRAVSLRRSP